MAAKTQKNPLIPDGQYEVKEVYELNFFSIAGGKDVVGTSNKSYHVELQVSKNDSNAQLFTMYGPTGFVQKSEWRHFDSEAAAKKELDRILKSKRKKGYKDIDIAQRALGSNEAKAIVKPVELKNAEHLKKQDVPNSNLHLETQRLIASWFKTTNDFVIETLDKGCPLGQLTNKQIEEGRQRLDEAKTLVNKTAGKFAKSDKTRLLELTNEFYSLIPHNLGRGARGKMEHLLLDDLQKIVEKENTLDTLLDAKSVGAVLCTGSPIDDQYKSLNADFAFVEHNDPRFNFIKNYFEASKVRQHGFSGNKVINVWSVIRKGEEAENFSNNLNKIMKLCKGYNYLTEAGRLYEAQNFSLDKRPDLDSTLIRSYRNANVWFCWHGTRSQNLVGITKRGLLIRPAGAIHTGAMFGSGLYFAHQSSKSLNYCDGGYWTGGKNTNPRRYMFLLDVVMGNMYLTRSSHYYTTAPATYHSVYAKAGYAGVMNDEMITYDNNPEEKQSMIKYLVEID